MKRIYLPTLCALLGLHSAALGQAEPIVDPSVDAILDQLQMDINSSDELKNLRARITATGESPALVPDPNAPRPAPRPQVQPRRVVIPGSTAPAAPDPTDAILAEMRQEISQNAEINALRNRLSNIPTFGPDFAEPSPPPPGAEPRRLPQDATPEAMQQPSTPLPQPAPEPRPQRREAPTAYSTVEESGDLPPVLPMPDSFALPNDNVPAPPVFQPAPVADTPPRRPEAPLELPSWNAPEAAPEPEAASAMPEPQPQPTAAQQNPFGSPRGQETPPESTERGKPGFFSRVFGRKNESNIQVQAAAPVVPEVTAPVPVVAPAPAPQPASAPVPEPPAMAAAPAPQPEPEVVSPPMPQPVPATEIASTGSKTEPEPQTTLLPSARIPAAEAKDPAISTSGANVPPLLKPLKLDWLKGGESSGRDVTEP